MLTEVAPAKLNLALHVRKRRADGYHQLETLFAFVRDGDLLAVTEGHGPHLSIEGPMAAGLSSGEDNLVLRAAQLLAQEAGIGADAHLRLTKNLPVASGLGGGSADAAAALRLLNRFWKLDWPLGRLAAMAEPLGADVPACVHSRPLLGTGKGDQLVSAVVPDIAGAPVLLVNPMQSLSTGPVFQAWDGIDRGGLGDDFSIAGLRQLRNDLEPGAIRLCPVITDVLEELSMCSGAFLTRMSGSGATCFAVFDNTEACSAAYGSLSHARPDWWFLPTAINRAQKPDLLPKF